MDRILIPENTLVVLCGPAGCGKSSFAARFFLPTQIVSSDDCRARVSDDPKNQAVSHHAFDLMFFIIRKRLLLKRLTVADATNLDSADRRELKKTARWFGFKAAAFVFDLPLETCLDRNAGRERVVPEEAIKMQFEKLESTRKSIRQEGFNYVFVLDQESQDEVIVEIGPSRY
ncbi:MAG TPA: AAA family ATPase [Blastocatellia bacterium]|nr:AAA family ATPase [Blastocatellia bacterium]